MMDKWNVDFVQKIFLRVTVEAATGAEAIAEAEKIVDPSSDPDLDRYEIDRWMDLDNAWREPCND